MSASSGWLYLRNSFARVLRTRFPEVFWKNGGGVDGLELHEGQLALAVREVCLSQEIPRFGVPRIAHNQHLGLFYRLTVFSIAYQFLDVGKFLGYNK